MMYMEAKLNDTKRGRERSLLQNVLIRRGGNGWLILATMVGVMLLVSVGGLMTRQQVSATDRAGTAVDLSSVVRDTPLPQTVEAPRMVIVQETGMTISFDREFTDLQMIQLISAWKDFARAVGSDKLACMEDLAVRADENGKWRAVYKISDREIVIKPSRFKAYAFIHELGHHLDLGCGASKELGAKFREAQHLGDQPWFQTRSWVNRPAEQFAEVLGEMVWGSRDEKLGINVTAASKGVIDAWLGDGLGRAVALSLSRPECTERGQVVSECQEIPYGGLQIRINAAGDVVGADIDGLLAVRH